MTENSKIPLDNGAIAIYSARSLCNKLEFMRRPKGIKTKKSVAKRFKINGTGKVMRSCAGKRHLLATKNSSAAAVSALPSRRRSDRCVSHHPKFALEPLINPRIIFTDLCVSYQRPRFPQAPHPHD